MLHETDNQTNELQTYCNTLFLSFSICSDLSKVWIWLWRFSTIFT